MSDWMDEFKAREAAREAAKGRLIERRKREDGKEPAYREGPQRTLAFLKRHAVDGVVNHLSQWEIGQILSRETGEEVQLRTYIKHLQLLETAGLVYVVKGRNRCKSCITIRDQATPLVPVTPLATIGFLQQLANSAGEIKNLSVRDICLNLMDIGYRLDSSTMSEHLKSLQESGHLEIVHCTWRQMTFYKLQPQG